MRGSRRIRDCGSVLLTPKIMDVLNADIAGVNFSLTYMTPWEGGNAEDGLKEKQVPLVLPCTL